MELKTLFKRLAQETRVNPYLSCEERQQTLQQLKQLLQKNAIELAQAVNEDFSHRAYQETLLLEIFPSINAIDYCLKNLKRWMKIRKKPVLWLFKPASAYVFPQPLGVIGVMVPWNYPLYLALVPLVYALAAGNRVMIKISEQTPKTGERLARLFNQEGIETSFVTIVNGDTEVAKKFANLPFNHLLFTGSTAVGREIMATAAKSLTPVTLELGGKSPVIISSSVNPNYFSRLFMGKLYNAGQTCIAPDYLLVPKGWEARIETFCKEFMAKHYPDLESNPDYSCLISAQHKERLQSYIDDAQDQNGHVIQIGKFESQKQKMPFYIVLNVKSSMLLMQEEIFGPILPVISYESFDEAVDFINERPKPLVIYYFGEDKQERKALEIKTLSGALTINDTLTHIAIDALPFGGIGESGIGHYHGQEGFERFSKLKPVFSQRRFAAITWFYPPYGKLIRYFLTWVAGMDLREKK